jgi:hypothetical protein
VAKLSETDERDEFDDELIGDADDEEAEPGEFALGDGDEADDEADDDDAFDPDDDEDAEVHTALLAKSEMLALLSLKTGARGGMLVRVDPRQPLPSAKGYDDAAVALRWFRSSLATSRRNGWHVVYEGAPLYG